MDDSVRTVADLVLARNSIDRAIARSIERPMSTGHLGEWLAHAIFSVRLEHNANTPGFDGHFVGGPLKGRSVNVKWYAKNEGLIDLSQFCTDFYLVFAGPRSAAGASHGTTRPLVIASVHLFDSAALRAQLTKQGVKLGLATSVRKDQWDASEIYPQSTSPALVVSAEQRELLRLFGPDQGPTG